MRCPNLVALLLPAVIPTALAAPAAAQDRGDQDRDLAPRPPTPQDYAAWRDHILPTADELGFEAIPWIPSFGQGLRTASEQGRPLLFYGMNGHPLGCT